MYDIKALYEAASVADAVRLRLEHPEAQILAGGTDVLVQVREGKRAGKELISIYGIDALRGVALEEDGTIRIGSLTSFSRITKDPIIQKYINVLGEAVDMVGGPQIRNAGTIGGNTCNGVTSADSASTLFAWDAVVELTGQAGIRRLPIQAFYRRAGVVDLRPDELLTGILIPRAAYEGYRGHYIKYAMREAMDIAAMGCSVNVKLTLDKSRVEEARIAYGVAGPVPMRAHSAEQAAKGRAVSEETCRIFAQAVLEDIRLVDLVGPDCHLHRVALVDPGDVHDLTADGGGEKAQVLSVLHLVQKLGDIVDEAHVQHPVRLIQDGGADLVDAHRAPLEVVPQAAGGGDDDLGPLFQRVDLLADGLAAVEADHADARLELGQLPHLGSDLEGQLPGGGQNDGLDLIAVRIHVLDDGDAEGEGLAGAGGGLGRHVLPIHHGGDAPRLDGC